jgi:hypothetical protein
MMDKCASSLRLPKVVTPESDVSLLTLIEPGEVKVDLADFDLKLQENFISTSHFFFDLFLQKRLPDLFELLT